MSSNNIYLEVLKGGGAILSYFLEPPTTQSIAVDYVEATRDELTYLSALTDHILPVGTVVSLAHLEAHRSRVKEAKATNTQHMAASRKATQKPSQSVTTATNKQPTNKAAKFKAGFKPAPNQRKQP